MQCPGMDERRQADRTQQNQALISSAGTLRTFCLSFRFSTDEGSPRGLCVIDRWVATGNESRGGREVREGESRLLLGAKHIP